MWLVERLLRDAALWICLLTVASNASIATSYDRDIDLYENSVCDLEDRPVRGLCVPLISCRLRLQQVLNNRRTNQGRCGFKGSMEIVCCPAEEIMRPGRKNNNNEPTSEVKILSITPETMIPLPTTKITTTTTTTSTTTTPATTTTTSTTTAKSSEILGRGVVRPAHVACSNYAKERTGRDIEPVEPFIINGERANFAEFPFMAALGFIDKDNPGKLNYMCGGSLIAPKYILTAAHCAKNLDRIAPVEVKLGATNKNSNTEDVQNIKVKKITVYPKYKFNQYYDDIAIIELETPANMTDTVSPICLLTAPLSLKPLIAQSLIVTGWGVTNPTDDKGSDDLMKTPSLALVEASECNEYYKGLERRLPRGIDQNSMICILDKNVTRSSDACQGDSGGPLVLREENGPSSLIGITSFGRFCGDRTPGVYTSVLYYLDWIESIVWPNKLA